MQGPKPPRLDLVETLHGQPVADPYRYFEDPKDPRTQAFIEANNTLTEQRLARSPVRASFLVRMLELSAVPSVGGLTLRGGKLWLFRSDGQQEQPVLCVAEGEIGRAERVLVDPNAEQPDGTRALTGFEVSPCGTWAMVGTTDGGSDFQTWELVHHETGRTGERIERAKHTAIAWLPDSSGFFYTRWPEVENPLESPYRNHSVWFHRRGTAQEADRKVFARPDQPDWSFGIALMDDGRSLVLVARTGFEASTVFLFDLATETARPVFDAWDARYYPAGSKGSALYVVTDKDAARERVLVVDTASPALSVREVVPEAGTALRSVVVTHDALVLEYLDHASSRVAVCDLDGTLRGDVALGDKVTVGPIYGDVHQEPIWLRVDGFARPASVVRLDPRTLQTTPVFEPPLPNLPEDVRTTQVFVTSKDGTQIPCFLVHKGELHQGGPRPTVLYGYGGFSIALTPAYSAQTLAWVEAGGVWVVANLRGGAEYGQDWHDSGTKQHKQRVFDDFIACAEWLLAQGITDRQRLAIHGGSNGGLLVGACLVQRPDLFGAASPTVGVLDMLRFHQFTVGRFWVSEYGSADDPAMFPHLWAYSPVHNVREGVSYPATLVTTGDQDDRVVPMHSYKFVAELQRCQAGPAPILMKVDVKAGHGFGTGRTMRLRRAADMFAFFYEVMGLV